MKKLAGCPTPNILITVMCSEPSNMGIAQISWKSLVSLQMRMEYYDARAEWKMHHCLQRQNTQLYCVKNQLCRLIITEAHRLLIHGGTNATLLTVRKKYWITKGRETVKRQLKRCQHCTRYTGGPFRMPEMPPFPKGKVTGGRSPFSTCGVDYFGPLMVKGNDGPTKAWVILFTCFTTCAVHLELVLDMTTSTFLMAFRRFISRRGTRTPTRMFSDNGKQFKLASSTIDSIWKTIDKCDDVLNYMTTVGTKWSFITELAPWQGGFCERMVQAVKRQICTTVRMMKSDQRLSGCPMGRC